MNTNFNMEKRDLIIIGGGQSALACGYFLRRTDIDYLMLDASPKCGGSWSNAWNSLTVFSQAKHSSLPGWFMPPSENEFPSREDVISYLCAYEKRYEFPIRRSIEVLEVTKDGELFVIKTTHGTYKSKAVISATGTYGNPFIPSLKGRDKFQGEQLHSSQYSKSDKMKDKKVLIVGEGNSGAQLLAEVSKVADTKWATRNEPEYLSDDVDGRVLFDVASAKYYAEQKGEAFDSTKYNLGNIVMTPPVKEARERGVLKSSGSFTEMDEKGVVWEDGSHENFDFIIWSTGFGYNTSHLTNMVAIEERGKIKTAETRALEMPGLWLVGYGGWTGSASATLIGVGRSAKKTVEEVKEYIKHLSYRDVLK